MVGPELPRESDFMGLFLSLIKKLLVISFFYAVLVNGQTWIPAIVNSFITIGTNATGLSAAQSPSDIMAQGIQICSDLFDKVNGANLLTQTGAALTTILMIVMVFASYLIIVLHYIVTKLEAIIVMTAGYIFLGFAGSRWTMPYFERYISLAISTGVRLMLIYLMLGVFKTVSQNWIAAMDAYTPDQPALQIFPDDRVHASFCFRVMDDPQDGGVDSKWQSWSRWRRHRKYGCRGCHWRCTGGCNSGNGRSTCRRRIGGGGRWRERKQSVRLVKARSPADRHQWLPVRPTRLREARECQRR